MLPVALAVILAQRGPVDWAREAAQSRKAEEVVAAANSRIGAELLRLLDDANPSVRHAALGELSAVPAAIQPAMLPRLVALLDDDALSVAPECGPLPEAEATAEGLIEAQLHCRNAVLARPPTVASMARAVLRLVPYPLGEALGSAYVARAAVSPSSAPRLAAAVRENQQVVRPILAALDAPRGDDATAALLLLVVASGASPATEKLAPLLTAKHSLVRRRAALVLLNAGAAAPGPAVAELEAELDDPKKLGLAAELSLLAYSRVTPLSSALARRLGAKAAADRVEALVALRGASPVPPPVVAAVAARLGPQAPDEEQLAALETLRSFGRQAAAAKAAVLKVVGASQAAPELAHLDRAAAALAAMEVKVSAPELAQLVAVYRNGCKLSVVRFGYHDTGLGQWCGAAESALATLAKRSGLPFAPLPPED